MSIARFSLFTLLAGFLFLQTGCAAFRLAGYAIAPDYPEFDGAETVSLAGLQEPVTVRQSADGMWHVKATNEEDLMFMTGYLQARDRLAQMDVFRHLALGRVSELVGDLPFGGKSSVETDLLNRALDFEGQARILMEKVSPAERRAMNAAVAGVNAWIAEQRLPLEHRLLGVDAIAPWRVEDSLAIYQMLMFNLSSNANREIRRLLLACAAGLDATERIWPTDIDFGMPALPPENWRSDTYASAPAVAPELRDEWEALCGGGKGVNRAAAMLSGDSSVLADAWSGLVSGFEASNSWVVAGKLSASGKPVFANDPHLPHMNPPIVWGVEQHGPDYRVAGFTLPGIHRVVFGHNGHVAWGATTNHVDRQDLVVYRPAMVDGEKAKGYEFEGEAVAFKTRTFTIGVKGGEARTFTVRYSEDGPLVNDVEPSLPGPIPLTAMRLAPLGEARDMDAARGLSFARTATDFVTAIRKMDSGCTNWTYATVDGDIGYESPCMLPVREGYSGAFPVAGWLAKYRWKGFVPKAEMPASANPVRGWIATANSDIIPADRFPTRYNNDSSAPWRYQRARDLILQHAADGYTVEEAAAMQVDVVEAAWPRVRATLKAVCDSDVTGVHDAARRALCGWNGAFTSDSIGATLYVLLSNSFLDRALTDELPGDVSPALWPYVQNIGMFEANSQWMWVRGEDDPVWDDVRTEVVETRADILRAAFADAVNEAAARYGDDTEDWAWGEAAPFRVRHLFAGKDGLLGGLLNSETYPGYGSPTTLFKNQFNRSDRDRFRATVGPSVRFVVDMADPWNAGSYGLAGGQSGWAKSPQYSTAVDDWRVGTPRALTAGDGVDVKFVPAAAD